ncbi:MAG: carbon starvation protein A [Acidobacteriota bacterium]|jgi:carbon starvation protein
MPAILLVIVGLLVFYLGWRFYSRFIADKIYRLAPGFKTPAHELEDGVDYVPTNRYVLWGHHFTSVAGAAPVVGPAIAVIWGWVPAFLWVILGTVFFAGVHDFGALWASVRHKGRSVGIFTEEIIGRRAKNVFTIVIFLTLLMVNAVFAVVIAKLMITVTSAVAPTWIVVGVAPIIGWLIYKKNAGLFWPTFAGIIILYVFIALGPDIPIHLPASVLGLAPGSQWIILLFIYCAVASLLPVWLLLQPRDYINGIQLVIALGIFYAAVFIYHPKVVAPAFNAHVPAGTPPLIPLLFVTIACGAISGFHGLVASGTSSKQLDKETDARFVGYLGAVGEGGLALVAILATTAGFATLHDWKAAYTTFAGGAIHSYVEGGARIIDGGLGLPHSIGANLLTVMLALFAATTMDTSVRLQRYIIQEWGQTYRIRPLTHPVTATLLAVGACMLLAFGAGGAAGTGGMIIWPLFGTTNQLLAALTLVVISILLLKYGRPVWYTILPMLFLLGMTVSALLYQLWGFYKKGNSFLVVMDLLILIASIWVVLEAGSAFWKARAETRAGAPAP